MFYSNWLLFVNWKENCSKIVYSSCSKFLTYLTCRIPEDHLVIKSLFEMNRLVLQDYFFFFFIKICFTRGRWFFLKFYVFWNGWTQRYPDFIVWNVKNSMLELGLWCVRFAIFQNRESFVIASTFFFFISSLWWKF